MLALTAEAAGRWSNLRGAVCAKAAAYRGVASRSLWRRAPKSGRARKLTCMSHRRILPRH